MPLISIITPVFNGSRYLPATLDSIIAQTERDWECIVVNDGSKDNTWEIIQEFMRRDPRIRGFNCANRGAAEARNFGVTQSSPDSKYIIFMDSDDLFTPDALSTLATAAAANPQMVGSHGLPAYINGTGKPLDPAVPIDFCRNRIGVRGRHIVPIPIDEPTDLGVLLADGLHPPGLFLVRRDIVQRIGPMDPTLWPANDWDYWIRAARLGVFAFVNKVIVHYRQHSSNATTNWDITFEMTRKVRYKSFYSDQNTPAQKDLMRDYYLAWNKHKIHEKWPEFRAAIRRGQITRAATLACHIAAHRYCIIRGYPTLRA